MSLSYAATIKIPHVYEFRIYHAISIQRLAGLL